ncbi:MAG TPA: crossover junction endodeoxyribonuclease RuvC [Candidatus Paceibacterota bacterium]|nr:crossover junction endodeoxyribonuclease RuvC [Candidatus Paceibacterota bacterium]
MRVLSIDPGYDRLGIAVIEKNKGSKETLVFSDCLETGSKKPHEERLRSIGEKIKEIIEDFKPEAFAIENLFLTNNQKTAMKVAEARGVILYEAANAHLPVTEFTPPQIKSAVCGNGKADKKAVMKMVSLLIKIEKKINHDDEFDAIAIGLAYFATKRF